MTLGMRIIREFGSLPLNNPPMKNYLQRFQILNDTEIAALCEIAIPKTLEKGAFLNKEGDVCTSVAFITSGILRSYYHASSSEEITYCFSFKNGFINAYSSFITQEKSMENIQALTQVSLLLIPKHQIDRLEKSSPNWMKFQKTVAENNYIKLERRIFMLQKEKAEVRYQDLLTNNPEIIQHIPLHYIASYLGISERHLSRIRKGIYLE